MSTYEHLLSKDPIGAFEKIREDYLRYFNTMYRFSDIRYKWLEDKKREAIRQDNTFCKEPYCEILSKYEGMEDDLGSLCRLGGVYNQVDGNRLPDGFANFVGCGLRNTDFTPYKHQFEMLCKGYRDGNNVLITSGTGSGKTESFLLPLFAALLKEAKEWGNATYNPNWWRERNVDGNYDPAQRDGEDQGRSPAIRSLLLYPMNALVADQVARLRKALDSDGARGFLDSNCKGNRIFFGSYNGKTRKAKNIGDLNQLAAESARLAQAARDHQCEPDDIYVSPRLSADSFTSEMLIREDMQQYSPDILITNVSMLSIMLMRNKEQGMLDQTKKYYENNPDAVFHLIVDELHLHRGTAGAEVAYLIRMFLDRIGVPPMKDGKRNPQLRIYASSASLGADAQTFLQDFFGVYDDDSPFIIVNGDPYKPECKDSKTLDYSHFDVFFKNSTGKSYYEAENDDEKTAIETEFLSTIGYNESFSNFVEEYSGVIYRDLSKFADDDHTSFPLSKFKELNGNPSDDAVRGFLIFRGNVKNDKLPNIRFHLFYHYIDGLWGELLPANEANGHPIGELMFHPEEISTNGKHKVLELLRCECCGEMFIGGNRHTLNNGNIGLSLNSANIDKIPNTQATPMVQNKTIDEYVVFWPSEGGTIDGFYSANPATNQYERFGIVNTNNHHTSETGNQDEHGCWRRGYLNPFDGTIKTAVNDDANSYISGFFYFSTVTRYNGIPLYALPCKCPKCGKDYRCRKYTQSPIRSFRTGIGRNNQLLSKELIYQLEDGEMHNAKLIGFSDSRQDAARQAMLISREHYRDMLRLIFIKLIEDKAKGNITHRLAEVKNIIIALLNANLPLDNVINTLNETNGIDTTDKIALRNKLQENVDNATKINNINGYAPRYDYIDLDKLISQNSNQIDGELIRELLRLGINPAGTEYSDMHPTANDYNWDVLYDFENLKLIDGNFAQNVRGGVLGTKVPNKIQENIFNNCFGQYMNVNTEAAGLGYIASSQTINSQDVQNLGNKIAGYLTRNGLTVEGVLNAFIRIFGDAHRFDSSDYDVNGWANYANWSASIKKAVRALAEKSNIDEQELGKLINHALRKVATDNNGKLVLNKPLRFKLAHKGDQYYKCGKCNRIHLHRGMGLCTNISCLQELPNEPAGKVEDLWKENYISYDVNTEPHSPRKLLAQELTGQTDDQMTRLLEFKDIVMDGNRTARSIDMLNVTTTMEVGVDIGSLQAIFQGNMPPTRYNYQQRVGRAGRRNQAFSAALTFCRGNSHDNYYYYKATDEITGGKPAQPTIAVNPIVDGKFNPVIIKRIVLKHIIMEISAHQPDNSDWVVGCDNTVGQLGYKTRWDIIKPKIVTWINSNEEEIRRIISYYLEQYDTHYTDEIFNWVTNDAVNCIDNAVNNGNSQDNALAIAEAGLLPMYGLPANIRKFFHGGTERRENRQMTYKSIDRDLELSITDFAPGSIKTKDAAEYESAGLTIDLEHPKGGTDPLQDSYNLAINGNWEICDITDYNADLINDNPQNNNPRVLRLVVPKAYRTDELFGNNGESNLNEDSRSNYVSSEIWVKTQDGNGSNSIEGGAAKWEVWNGSSGQQGEVWHINTNNNNYFRGFRARERDNRRNRNNDRRNDNYWPAFMISDLIRNDNNWDRNGQEETIAIGCKKVTDILCLSLDANNIPECLNLNATTGNKSAIIAAFYSAATLIQRTFADEIDIQPEEIEISEVKINEDGWPSVYMNDKTANGAGFISLLCRKNPATGKAKIEEIMEDIASNDPKSRFIKAIRGHSKSCKTSCQECLNTFYNRGLHHVLDWRLGTDLIKLMIDKNYKMGYEELVDTPYKDLKDVVDELGRRVEHAHPDGNVKYHTADGNDWKERYFTTRQRGNDLKEHLVHPLWNVNDQNKADGYYAQNIFNIQRVPKEEPRKYVAPDNHNAQTSQASNSSNDYGPLG